LFFSWSQRVNFQPFDLFRLFAQFFIWPEGVVIEDRR